jgi:hypothetical protein
MREARIRVILADRRQVTLAVSDAERLIEVLWLPDRRGSLTAAVKISEALRRRPRSVVHLTEPESAAFLAAQAEPDDESVVTEG